MIQFLIRRNRDITKKIKRRAKKEENFVYKEKGYYYLKEFEYNKNTITYLNLHYPSGIFRLIEHEQGGQEYKTKDSFAQIVCGLNGEKLIPIKRINHGFRANKIHGSFIGNDLCVIQCTYNDRKEICFKLIEKHISKMTGEYTEKILWQGIELNANNCPLKFVKYKEAILTCIKKVKDYNCTDLYYYYN